MHITYIPETDTIDFDFRAERGAVFETIDGPNEDILLDFDKEGRLVGMTIENASCRTDLESLRKQPQFSAVTRHVEA